MNQKDLRPANSFAQNYGVKMIGFGPPGTGKTPLSSSAPNPVLMFVEPGMLSMRGSNIPTYDGTTPDRADEFFAWIFGSAEAKKFDTVCIDSASQLAEMYLKKELARNSHGLKAYGAMATKTMDHLNGLYYMKEKHVYLICKQTTVDESGVETRRPYFPGKELNVQVPHLYDEIIHIAKTVIPGYNMGKPTLALRTAETLGLMARDRTGKLAEFEPPDLTAMFKKAMA